LRDAVLQAYKIDFGLAHHVAVRVRLDFPLYATFGDVMDTDFVIRRLTQNGNERRNTPEAYERLISNRPSGPQRNGHIVIFARW
jgi:hypothetical protein